MKHQILSSAAIAAAAMALAGPAAATSSATATVTGFSITLYDLDPSDGIDPELTFTSEGSYSSAYVYSLSESDSDSSSAPGHWSPTSAMAMLGFGQAQASTDSTGATAMGSVSGPSYGGQGSFSADGYGVNSGFMLTPWTGMKLTLSFDGTATTSVGEYLESAGAYGQLQIGVSVENGNETHYAYRNAYASCLWDGSICGPESNSFSGTFSLSFANLSDQAADGWMYADAYAYGQSTVPVPEPQTYLMLLAGLAGIGAVVRRRRKS